MYNGHDHGFPFTNTLIIKGIYNTDMERKLCIQEANSAVKTINAFQIKIFLINDLPGNAMFQFGDIIC